MIEKHFKSLENMEEFPVLLLLFHIVYNVEGISNTTNYDFLDINANRSAFHEEDGGRNTAKPWIYPWVHYHTKSAPPHVRKHHFTPDIISKTCLLVPQMGPCRANIPMYYFNPDTKNCSAFLWGGCQGNGNRFDTLRDCLSTCLSKPGAPPKRPRYCQLTFDYGWCFGAEERWYYDFRYKVCKKTIYSGCGGNKNNFYNRENCDQICRFGNPPLGDKSYVDRSKKRVIIVDPNELKRGETQMTQPPANH